MCVSMRTVFSLCTPVVALRDCDLASALCSCPASPRLSLRSLRYLHWHHCEREQQTCNDATTVVLSMSTESITFSTDLSLLSSHIFIPQLLLLLIRLLLWVEYRGSKLRDWYYFYSLLPSIAHCLSINSYILWFFFFFYFRAPSLLLRTPTPSPLISIWHFLSDMRLSHLVVLLLFACVLPTHAWYPGKQHIYTPV